MSERETQKLDPKKLTERWQQVDDYLKGKLKGMLYAYTPEGNIVCTAHVENLCVSLDDFNSLVERVDQEILTMKPKEFEERYGF